MAYFVPDIDNINKNLSLYIPVIYQGDANIKYIRSIFHKKNFGHVYHVDFVPHKGNPMLFSAFIYLNWYKTNVVCYLQELIIEPDERISAKIFHSNNNQKYFWIIRKNTSTPKKKNKSKHTNKDVQHIEKITEQEKVDKKSRENLLKYRLDPGHGYDDNNDDDADGCCVGPNNSYDEDEFENYPVDFYPDEDSYNMGDVSEI